MVLRGKFIAVHAYLRKQEKSQCNFTPQETRKKKKKKIWSPELVEGGE